MFKVDSVKFLLYAFKLLKNEKIANIFDKRFIVTQKRKTLRKRGFENEYKYCCDEFLEELSLFGGLWIKHKEKSFIWYPDYSARRFKKRDAIDTEVCTLYKVLRCLEAIWRRKTMTNLVTKRSLEIIALSKWKVNESWTMKLLFM